MDIKTQKRLSRVIIAILVFVAVVFVSSLPANNWEIENGHNRKIISVKKYYFVSYNAGHNGIFIKKPNVIKYADDKRVYTRVLPMGQSSDVKIVDNLKIPRVHITTYSIIPNDFIGRLTYGKRHSYEQYTIFISKSDYKIYTERK